MQGGFVVVTDMIIAIVSIYLNLMVTMAIKEEDELTQSVGGATKLSALLSNLCTSNIVAAALVKSIAIVQNSYMVAASLTSSEVPFCLLYTVSWRATSATLPWSIVLGCWGSLTRALTNIQVFNNRGNKMWKSGFLFGFVSSQFEIIRKLRVNRGEKLIS